MAIQEEQWRRVLEILNKLDEEGCLEYVMLIGSWADYLYSVAGVLPDYESRIRTLDLDFLVYNIRRPREKKDAVVVFKELGFIVEKDRVTDVTKLLDPANGFEVEFLVQQMGSGVERYMRTNLGVTAQALRHFNILANNKMKVHYLGKDIVVPCPEAFILNKMIINSERSDYKAEKDIVAINNMYPHIDKNKFNELKESLTKKEKTLVNTYMESKMEKQ